MNKLFRVIPLATALAVSAVGVSFAQQVRENQSFRYNTKIEKFYRGHRKISVVKNFVDETQIPDAYGYSQYADNCWWKGLIYRQSMEYDHNNKRWSVTFIGKLKMTDSFRQEALDKKGKVFGEITSTAGLTALPGEKPKAKDKDSKSKIQEVRIRLADKNHIPQQYYYEEYDQVRKCYYGGELVLNRTYEENGKTFARYVGYIHAAY